MTKSKNVGSGGGGASVLDHADLIRELPQIERMTNQERLKLAHNRRKLQLKNWAQNEKLWAANGNAANGGANLHGNGGSGNNGSVKRKQRIISTTSMGGGGNNNNKVVQATTTGGGDLVPPKVPKTARIRFKNSIMLLEAAGRSDVDEVRRLLESGVDPDMANEDGLTALHQCCIDDNEELLKLLLEFGANVNSEDSERWTPLHAAATCGHLHLVKHLIAKGANLLGVNAEGNMPYDICDEEGTLDYIESEMAKRGVTQDFIEDIRALPETKMLQDMQFIQAEDGDLHARDPDGATFLHIAAANGYLRVVEFLLDNHVSTDCQDKDCWQPIHAAACWGHMDVLELLVHHGADLNARTKNNETPYAICEDPELKERIIQLRSELETKLREKGVRQIRRSQSSNSRTQSIRRTSQRDKGLTSKRDVADEAQMLMTITHINIKDNSPSPTSDVGGGGGAMATTLVPPPPPTNPPEVDLSSGGSDEEVELKSLPPSLAFGRDSITQLADSNSAHLSSTRSSHPHRTPKYVNNHNNNLVTGGQQLTTMDNNRGSSTDLPTPDISPTIEVQPSLGKGGQMSLSAGGGKKMAAASSTTTTTAPGDGGNNTIDIHVQVTINTNSPTQSSSSAGRGQGHGQGQGHGLYHPPGTLADLKKQRSLHYASHSRSNSFQSNNGAMMVMMDPPPKYEPPPSPTHSLKRFTGHPGDMVNDYSSSNRRKCCSIV